MQRRRNAGMTLIEIMIVVIIMALIATAVGMAVVPILIEQRVRLARTDLVNLSTIAETWSIDHRGCPTVEDLIDDGLLPTRSKLDDPWGTAYIIECEANEFIARSAGEDGQFETDDDLE